MAHFALSELNFWAILVAGIINMAIGATWYSTVLFGNKWMDYLGFKEEDINPSPWLYVVVFILGLLIAFVMALFLQGSSGVVQGLAYGAVIGIGLVIPTMITHYLYEQRKGGFIFIVAGHELVVFLAYGALLAGWQ